MNGAPRSHGEVDESEWTASAVCLGSGFLPGESPRKDGSPEVTNPKRERGRARIRTGEGERERVNDGAKPE